MMKFAKTNTTSYQELVKNISNKWRWLIPNYISITDGAGCERVFQWLAEFEEYYEVMNDGHPDGAKLGSAFSLGYLTKEKIEILTPIKEVLTNSEREYLKAVIKPFRKKTNVIRVTKVDHTFLSRFNILISLEGDHIDKSSIKFNLPDFSYQEQMYLGMEPDRGYLLRDLGIVYDD